jgi:UDP-N-acetylglucosamine 2-epimerase (non-hydrolysing)
MKIAPILRAFQAHEIPALLVHTGQHYDPEMNDRFFSDLALPAPDVNLRVGSASHAIQTAEIMRRFEPVVDEHRPAAVLVVGDVNSTIACALVAAKKDLPVIHVEAGLRSYDRRMPEEVNRVLTDQISELLYTTERSAAYNLAREGISEERVHFVGNVMIDSLRVALANAIPPRDALRAAGVAAELVDHPFGYGIVTLHRPSNVDQPNVLALLLDTLAYVSKRVPLVFAAHPRTRRNIVQFGLQLRIPASMVLIPPQGYFEMLGLMANAKLVMTDSGGIQEETTVLGVPCLTLRDNTERPITVDQGTNTLVGQNPDRVLACVEDVLISGGKRGRTPELWDGFASQRIAVHLAKWLGGRNPEFT